MTLHLPAKNTKSPVVLNEIPRVNDKNEKFATKKLF